MANSALALRHRDCGLALLMDRSPRLLQPRARSPSANSTTAAAPSQAPPLICSCAGVCTAVQIHRGAQMVMAVDSPLSRQASQPEQTTQPPAASNTRRQQVPHGLQPQPQAAATFSPASAAASEHRTLVLPRLPERPRPDPRAAARLSHRRHRIQPRSCRPR